MNTETEACFSEVEDLAQALDPLLAAFRYCPCLDCASVLRDAIARLDRSADHFIESSLAEDFVK